MSMRWLRFSIPLAVVPVLLLLAYGFWTNPREIPSPLIGKPAATFTLTSFAGDPMSLERHRGRVVMLNFWASWCRPACYEEAPVIERAWQAYRDKGVVVLGVDVQDQDEAARKFIAQFEHTFPNAPDPGGRVAVDYGVYGVPETFFIDRQGRVRFKQVVRPRRAAPVRRQRQADQPYLPASAAPALIIRSRPERSIVPTGRLFVGIMPKESAGASKRKHEPS